MSRIWHLCRTIWQKCGINIGFYKTLYIGFYLSISASFQSPPCHFLCQGFFPFLSCRIFLTKSLVRLVGIGGFVQGCFLELFFQSYLSEFVLLGLFGRICSMYLFDAKGCWQDWFGREILAKKDGRSVMIRFHSFAGCKRENRKFELRRTKRTRASRPLRSTN